MWAKYEMTAAGRRYTVTVTVVGTEERNGVTCWRVSYLQEGQGPGIEMTMWFDASTGEYVDGEACVGGTCTKVPAPAYVSGDYRVVGTETVTVPAGTFECVVAESSSGGRSWWSQLAPPLGIVKADFEGGSMELVELGS